MISDSEGEYERDYDAPLAGWVVPPTTPSLSYDPVRLPQQFSLVPPPGTLEETVTRSDKTGLSDYSGGTVGSIFS